VVLHEIVAALVIWVTFGLGFLEGRIDTQSGVSKLLDAPVWLGEWVLLTALAQALFLRLRFPGVRLVAWCGASLGAAFLAVPTGLFIGLFGFFIGVEIVRVATAAGNAPAVALANGVMVLVTVVASTLVPGLIIGGAQALVLMDRATLKGWTWILGSGVGTMVWFWPTVLGFHHYDDRYVSAPVQAAAGLLLGTGLYAISTAVALATAGAQRRSALMSDEPVSSPENGPSSTC
jgi:hypothetical protein